MGGLDANEAKKQGLLNHLEVSTVEPPPDPNSPETLWEIYKQARIARETRAPGTEEAYQRALNAYQEACKTSGHRAEADLAEAREIRMKELADRAPLVSEFVIDALEMMERRAHGQEKPIKMPKEWPRTAQALGGGLWPGLYILTGTTAAGKSQWALQTALTAARNNHPVLYIGLELDRAQLIARLLGFMFAEKKKAGAAMWSHLYLGKAPEALREAQEMANELSQLPIRLEEGDSYGWNADKLYERINAMREAHPEPNGPGSLPILVILDYLQIVAASPNNPREDIRERIGKAAYAGRSIARNRKINASVLLLSSIARDNANKLSEEAERETLGTGDASRLVGFGKESGEIEFAADAVMCLAREAWKESEDGKPPANIYTHLAVAKARTGRPSWQLLKFNGALFEEADDSEYEAVRSASDEASKKQGESGKNYRAELRAKAKEDERKAAEARTEKARIKANALNEKPVVDLGDD